MDGIESNGNLESKAKGWKKAIFLPQNHNLKQAIELTIKTKLSSLNLKKKTD